MKNKNALKYEMTDWKQLQIRKQNTKEVISCLLYTSDAADEL